jgi:hypothetical protein
MGPIKLLARGVTGAYGLAKEAMADHEVKKSPGYSHLDVPSHDKNDGGSSDDASSISSSDGEEAAQELDEVQQQFAAGNDKLELDNAQNVEEVFDTFMKKHPAPKYSPVAGKLELPVILPQRRPKNKERGFVRAYAPILQTCGVEEAEFLDFLDGFGKAIQVWTPPLQSFQTCTPDSGMTISSIRSFMPSIWRAQEQ